MATEEEFSVESLLATIEESRRMYEAPHRRPEMPLTQLQVDLLRDAWNGPGSFDQWMEDCGVIVIKPL